MVCSATAASFLSRSRSLPHTTRLRRAGSLAGLGRLPLLSSVSFRGLAVVSDLKGALMFTGVLELELLLGDVRSLKEKRSVVRPVVSELRRRFEVAAAEAGHLDLHRRALVGVAVVAADAGHCRDVMDRCERLVAARPELEVLSARQRLYGDED